MHELKETTHLKGLWNEDRARELGGNQLALLRYRSNLLGADLRITNFGGGNTSSKIELPDPFTGQPTRVLAVKGSGGDIGSITESGFALLHLDRLEHLKTLYRGEKYEDEMVALLSPLCLRTESCRRFDRHSLTRILAFFTRGSLASRLGHRPCLECKRQAQTRTSSTENSGEELSGFPGSAPGLNWR